MGLLEAGQLKLAAEKMAEVAWEQILLPAAEKLVANTENKWDDTALLLVKDLVKDVINSISDKDGD